MTEPLEILIKKGISGSDGTAPNPTNQQNKPPESGTETTPAKNIIGAQVVSLGKQALLLGIRNYGAITGQARTQQRIENAINVAGAVATFAVAGPVVGGIVVGAQAVLGGVQSAVNQGLDRRQQSFNNERLGVITKNGNR